MESLINFKYVLFVVFVLTFFNSYTAEVKQTQVKENYMFRMVNSTSAGESLRQWQQILSGTRLHYYHTYRSYSGGFTRVQRMDLCPQGFYNFYSSTSFDMLGDIVEAGTWHLKESSGNVILVLTPTGGTPTDFRLRFNEEKNIMLNAKAFIPAKTGKYAPQCN